MMTVRLPENVFRQPVLIVVAMENIKKVFAGYLVSWQRRYGRHGLPWHSRDPYRVWLSEIMLQQTQVATVKEYYPRFLAAFPTVADLAAAEEDVVLALWAGLGYYSRARNLHKAAKQVVGQFGGHFPDTRAELEQLCGVGRSTAAAIAAFAFHRRETILDGNVKRVLCRVLALDGAIDDAKFTQELWQYAEQLLPECADDMPAYTQGLMDLGATVCKRSKPLCGECPMQTVCLARQQGRTAELPKRRKSVEVVVLPMYWLVLRNRQGAIWLEKRAANGIWAGLYCVPVFSDYDALCRAAAEFGLLPEDLSAEQTFTHRLTHRLLEIQMFSGSTERLPETVNGMWVLPQELHRYALPKPLSVRLETVIP